MTCRAVKQFKLDPRARKVTFQKRKAGLIKIMKDLKILCGVDVCLVMYETPDAIAEVWPSRSEALRLVQECEDAKNDEIAALEKKLNELEIFKAELDSQMSCNLWRPYTMRGPVPLHFRYTFVAGPDACGVTKDVLSFKSASRSVNELVGSSDGEKMKEACVLHLGLLNFSGL
ncbi:transcription factor, MADS-box [Artemisia annua]|uniref:Transcription factor, MADS-box n=1 Tax=Artemisia annua TaxID=35608 RepID=A0A2U1M4D8_ARTAN|nr:transcription factor, MADS-box [Artemisia annua]